MRHAAEPDVTVPFKCDPTIEPCWYWNDYTDVIVDKFKSAINKGANPNELFKEYCETYSETPSEQLKEILKDFMKESA